MILTWVVNKAFFGWSIQFQIPWAELLFIPIWVTTVALVAGFLVLVFSGFKMNADMGLMSALTITLALAMDFLFLPTLLIKIEAKRMQQAPARDSPAESTPAKVVAGRGI